MSPDFEAQDGSDEDEVKCELLVTAYWRAPYPTLTPCKVPPSHLEGGITLVSNGPATSRLRQRPYILLYSPREMMRRPTGPSRLVCTLVHAHDHAHRLTFAIRDGVAKRRSVIQDFNSEAPGHLRVTLLLASI